MKILFITPLLPPLRDSRALLDFLSRWQQDHEITVVCPVAVYLRELFDRQKIRKKTLQNQSGVPVRYFPVVKIPRWRFVFTPILRFLRRNAARPDVIVAHFKLGLEVGYRYARKTGRPLVIGLHASDINQASRSAGHRRKLGRILSHAARIAGRSLPILQKTGRLYPGTEEKSFFAFSGIPRREILSDRKLAEKMDGLKNQPIIRLVTVSSLIPRKHIREVLLALRSLTHRNWRYTVVGQGEQFGELTRRVRLWGLQDKVEFRGPEPRSEVLRILTRSHVFIMISADESFGLAYLEALARGNLVIASRDEGMDGIIVDQHNGFLCPAGDPRQLGEILDNIFSRIHREKIQRIWRQSIRTAGAYSLERAARHYLDQLQALVKNTGSLPGRK